MAEAKRKSSLTYDAMMAVKGYLKSDVPAAAENRSIPPPMQQVYPQQVFRPTFNLPEIIAPPRPPYSRPGTGHKSVQSFGLQSNASTRYSAGSLGGRSLIAGSFRTQDEVQGLSSEMMAEFLYKQQRLKQWATSMPEEGIMLKRSKGEYACCPESLGYVRGGFYDQVMEMNVRCAMTVNSNVIRQFVASHFGDFASLQGGLSVQILPNMSYLSKSLKHQFAAFIRDRRCLVVWDDDPKKIIENTQKLESLLVATVWNDGADDADDEKSITKEALQQINEQLGSEEGYVPEVRRIQLLSPFIVACTLVLIIAALGLGCRKLAIEISYDGSYARLGLLLTLPLFFFMGIFTMQAIASNIMQVIGPVHQVVQNTRNYSGKPPKRIVAGEFPHVTIQMPVYKEGLNAVIKPTVMSLKQAISTYELQGGTANIFINDDGMQIISEEEATKRRDFYAEHDIGWVARPKHNPPPPLKKRGADFDPANHFTRKGKFKKASNMNFALMVSNKVEEKLQHVERHETWSKWDEKDAYDLCFASVLKELNGVAWAEGNIRMGDYILIVDSDTRVPSDCLLDAASEMEQSPEIAIMQFTSGVMKVTTSFFESGITFFTDLVYTAIRYAVASGDVCPFVGHNAILRWSAIQQIGYTDEDGYEKFWSESHVSEDFDMALRLQTIGYSLRLAAYQGEGFKEGVSLTVYDELARWEKYAYGCNELLFHPLRFWPVRGPFTPLFKRFVTSTMPIGAKLTIMAYIGTYYAIGSAWILTLANYFLMGWYLEYIDKFYLDSFAILFAIIVIFNGLTNVTLAVLRYRTGDRGLMESLWENFKWVPLLSIFLSGLSLHVSQALLSHMLEIDMSWGATAKEVEDTSFFQELPKLIKKFRGTFVFSFGCFVLLVVCAVAVPEAWRIQSLVAVYPLGSIAVGHLLLPVVLNPALMMFTW